MKKPLDTSITILAVFVIMVVIGITLGNDNSEKDKLVIYFPIDEDFLNPEQGTAVFEFRFPDTEFKVGDEIGGYCNGYFGDDYEDKICISVAPKYAVFLYEDGNATVLSYVAG